MQDLIKRIEAADGPDRELDAVIWLAETPGATRKQWSYIHKATGRECHVDETRDNGLLIVVPPYTSSIDAAMTLVPEGWGYQIMPLFCVLRHPESSYYSTSKDVEAHGKAPALALCAAALRARMGAAQ